MKIKAKLCLIFGIILTLTLLITSYYGYIKVDSVSSENNYKLLKSSVNLKAKAIDEKLLTIFNTLTAISSEFPINAESEFDFEVVLKSLKNIQAQTNSIESYFAVENGITYQNEIEDGPIPNFNAKEKQREWYLKIFRDHSKMFISQPYLSVTTQKYVIAVGVPVIRGGKEVASLCIDIEMGDITNFIVSLSDNNNIFTTNKEGTIFASANPDEIGKNLFEIHPEFKQHTDKNETEFDFIWKEKDNEKYKMLVKKLTTLDWNFWQYESYKNINSEANSFLIDSITFFVSALIISLTIIYFIANMIAKPIIATSKLITKIAETGDTNLRELDKWSTRKDEIGTMSKSFDQMIEVLHEKAATANEIARGNMTVEVKVLSEQDHLGIAFRMMINDLNQILTQVNTSVNEVTNGAEQISTTSHSLSDGATKQAASTEEISASIAELSSQTKTNAENATLANKLASETAEAAKSGQERMNQLSGAMNEISANAEQTQKVIKTIDDIAFQTNLLALNAAVEAARAGIHGKGFAVVAEEVRNLAARSAKAAKETADLIQNSNNQINEGVIISQHTAESFNMISENVIKTSDTIHEIAIASQEQAEGIAQIGIGLEQIDTVTQENTASTEEAASASAEMSNQARTLQKLVSHFRLKQQAQSTQAASQPKQIVSRSTNNTNRIADPKAVSEPQHSKANLRMPESTSDSASMIKPNDQIILDDSEFGKY